MHEYVFLNSAPGGLPAAESPAPSPGEPPATAAHRSRRQTIQSIALVLAGLLVGVLIVSTLTHRSAAQRPAALEQAAVPPAATTVDPPRTHVLPPTRTLAADQIVGQIRAVGNGSLTLSRLDGSDSITLTVSTDTMIIKDGVRVQLGALRAGDVAAVELSGTKAQTIVVGGQVGRQDRGFGGRGDDDLGGTNGSTQSGTSAGGTST